MGKVNDSSADKKHLSPHIAALAIFVLILPAFFAISAFFLPPVYDETYLAALNIKMDALCGNRRVEAEPGEKMHKIVMVGGSGTAFGQYSSLLERELSGYRVVNFGLYAGMGTAVMLELTKPYLEKGDIVIFSPELSSQTLSMYFQPKSMWQAADGSFSLMLPLLGTDFGSACLASFPEFAADKARYTLSGDKPEGSGVYAKSSFNEYGDIVYRNRDRNQMASGYDANQMINFDIRQVEESFAGYVGAYAKECEKNGIRFFYRFCPMNVAAVEAANGIRVYSASELRRTELNKLRNFSDKLESLLDCRILGKPEEALMDAAWFYDTNFHLNSAGAVMNTRLLAQDLKNEFHDRSDVAIKMPELPETDYSDNVLTSAELISENGEEIVVSKQFKSIADGAFADKKNLRRIIMENEDPSACTVGKNLLKGTDAVIIVPSGALSSYKTDYFWSAYADRIFGRDYEDNNGTVSPTDNIKSTDSAYQEGEPVICYDPNGGSISANPASNISEGCYIEKITGDHLRPNTAQGTLIMNRKGYALIGWNTKADGAGAQIGLGSRMDKPEGGADENKNTKIKLYAQWIKESSGEEFVTGSDGEHTDGLSILSWKGKNNSDCVIPSAIDGKRVTSIGTGAFDGKQIRKLVLPVTLRQVSKGAFADTKIQSMYMYDTLEDIEEGALRSGSTIEKMHVQAARRPVYSISYFATFADKYDYLKTIKNSRKIVLFSGSSARYGYDTPMIIEAFPDYECVNMGVYAWTGARPQLELIRKFMKKGDILLSAPEFDAIEYQFCMDVSLDKEFWAMMEADYDTTASLNLSKYDRVLESFAEYQKARRGMMGRNYSMSPSGYDDEGNRYGTATYNRYGDFILPRELSETDARLRSNITDYTEKSFPDKVLDSLQKVYDEFIEDGIKVLFTYTPRNINSLTEASTGKERSKLDQSLRKRLKVPVITDIEATLYQGRYFWKIDSHTGTQGARMRTGQVIEDLRKFIN